MLTIWLMSLVVLWLITYLYHELKKSMYYWKERGVPHYKPIPIIGNYWPVLTLKKNAFLMYAQAYSDFPDEPVVGLYEFTTPTLLVKDPELVKEVLIGNFTSFQDHGNFIFEPSSLMYEGIFILQGDRWRAIRNQLVKTFTTGRMKDMYSGMVEYCEEVVSRCPQRLDRNAFSDIATDMFLRSLFGAKLDRDGEIQLRQTVKKMFGAPVRRYLQQQMLVYFPKLADFLGAKYMPQEMDDYFKTFINRLLDMRESLVDYERKDYLDVLVQIRNKDKMNVYDKANNKTSYSFDVTNNFVISQAFMFFFAGMDTTSLALLYCAFDIASTPDVQEKAREEVRRVLKKHGKFTYDSIREMSYIQQCIEESLRIHPTLAFLMRVCERNTKVGNVQLDKGTRLIIPNLSLQNDPKYFPEPEKYDPDRFDKSAQINKYAYLPFSDGPRVCLGKKFSIVEITTCLAHLLEKFELTVDPETVLPMEFHPRTAFLTPKTPVVIKLTKLASS